MAGKGNLARPVYILILFFYSFVLSYRSLTRKSTIETGISVDVYIHDSKTKKKLSDYLHLPIKSFIVETKKCNFRTMIQRWLIDFDRDVRSAEIQLA